MSVEYVCDWCRARLPRDKISHVVLYNVYNDPLKLHICHGCAQEHMPAAAQPMISWTAP